MKKITDAFGNWFAGFTDGEGCFIIAKRNRKTPRANYECQFKLELRDDDKPILEEIRDKLGIGKIYDVPACPSDVPNARTSSRLIIGTIAECVELVKIFEKYPLRAKKRHDFEIWKQAIIEFQKPFNYRNMDLLEYCFLKIREVRQYEKQKGLTIPKIKELQLIIKFVEV